MKQPKELLFFRGAIFEINYNKEGKLKSPQSAFLPSKEDPAIWHKIKNIKAPLGLLKI